MLTPDYQEFAKRAPASIRDNTVICDLGTSRKARNPPGVAPLPRQISTKRELFADAMALPHRRSRLSPTAKVANC
jgi:hypothetical protein